MQGAEKLRMSVELHAIELCKTELIQAASTASKQQAEEEQFFTLSLAKKNTPLQSTHLPSALAHLYIMTHDERLRRAAFATCSSLATLDLRRVMERLATLVARDTPDTPDVAPDAAPSAA